MKYVLMYTNRPDLDESIPKERREEVYNAVYGWFVKHEKAFSDAGAELQESSTATTVKSPAEPGGEPVVVDGPFSEAKENVGGFSVIDVPPRCGPRDGQGVAVTRLPRRGDRDPPDRRQDVVTARQ